MSKDQSGPAFPNNSTEWSNRQEGMTKRELIAMGQMKAWRTSCPASSSKDLAQFAIQDADALLAELGRE